MSFFNKPQHQALAFLLVLLAAYIYLARPVEAAQDVALAGEVGYLATGAGGLRVINLAHPGSPQEVGYYDSRGTGKRVVVNEERLYLADGKGGLQILDVEDPSKLRLIASLPGNVGDVILQGDRAYLAAGREGVIAVQVKDPKNPKKLSSARVKGSALAVTALNKWVYAADSGKIFHVIDYRNDKAPKETGALNIQAQANQLALFNNFAVIAAGEKGLLIVDISNPEKPEISSRLGISGEARGVTISGFYAYVAAGDRGIRVIDLSDPYTPQEIGSMTTSGDANRLVVVDDQAYVAEGFEGLQVYSTRVVVGTNFLGSSNIQAKTEDAAKSGRFIFVAAGERGLRAVDAANPQRPREVGFFDTPGYANALALRGDLAFVADQGGGLRVIDIANPGAEMKAVSQAPASQNANDVLVNGNWVFMAAGETGLHIYDFTDPFQPQEVSRLGFPGQSQGLAALGEYIYVAAGGGGLRIVNILDIARPTEISWVPTIDARGVAIQAVSTQAVSGKPSLRYDAQLGDNSTQIYAYVADGGHGLRVIEVSNPRAPQEIAVLPLRGYLRHVLVTHNLAFVSASGEGFYVLEVSNPAQPRLVSTFRAAGEVHSLMVDGTTAFVSAYEHGLRVVDLSQLDTPKEIGAYDAPATVKDVVTAGDMAYMVDGMQGMWALDVQDPLKPREAGSFTADGETRSLTLVGDKAYIAAGPAGVQIVSVADPQNLAQVGIFDQNGDSQSVAIAGNLAYIAGGRTGIRIYNVSRPEAPSVISSYATGGSALRLAISGEYLFVAEGVGGIESLKISDPAAPSRVSQFMDLKDVRDLVVAGPFAFVAAGADGLRILDISRPLVLSQVAALRTLGPVESISLLAGYAFLSEGASGVEVVDVTDPYDPVSVGSAMDLTPALKVVPVTVATDTNQSRYFRLYVAGGTQGLRLFEARKSIAGGLEGEYEVPGTATPAQIYRAALTFLSGNLAGVSSKAIRTVIQVVFDVLVMGVLGLLFWLALLSFFILPLPENASRLPVFSRLVAYLMQAHGAAVHIKEGRIIQQSGEEKRRGPGIALVDLSSAILIRRHLYASGGAVKVLPKPARKLFKRMRKPKPVKNRAEPVLRVAGPGVNYLNFPGLLNPSDPYEVVQGVVDLRPQVRIDLNVQGCTRDGIEVTCKVLVVFTLGQPPQILQVGYQGDFIPENLRVVHLEDITRPGPNGRPQRLHRVRNLSNELEWDDREEIHRFLQGMAPSNPLPAIGHPPESGAPFHFDPKRVFAACYPKAQKEDGEAQIPWTELPVKVAVEIFHDLLPTYPYDMLYLPDDPTRYPLRDVKGEFSRAVRNQGVIAYQYVGRKDHQPLEMGQEVAAGELEYGATQTLRTPKVLRARGIKVIAASFTELKPVSPEVRAGQLDRWRAQWEKQAQITRAEHELEAMRIRNQARLQAERTMTNAFSQLFKANPYSEEALAIRVFQALEAAAADPLTRQLLPSDTIAMLRNLQYWLVPDWELRNNRPPITSLSPDNLPPSGPEPEMPGEPPPGSGNQTAA